MAEPFTFWRVCFRGGSQGFEIVNCAVGSPEVDLASGSLMVPWIAQQPDGSTFTTRRYYPMHAVAYWEEITLPSKPPNFAASAQPPGYIPFPPGDD